MLMLKLAATVLIVFTSVDAQTEQLLLARPVNPICTGRNEVFLRDGPGCPQTCKTFNQDCYANNPVFKPDCYCIPGYVRDTNNICVEGNKFCGNCTTNEYYTENGSPCQTECSTLGKPCTIVNKKPSIGCYCKAGYARNAAGVCVTLDKCPTLKCPINEEFQRYGFCEGNCDNPFGYCTRDCLPPGCYCKGNYVRYNGLCILYDKCPVKKCGNNEEYLMMGICEGTCKSPFAYCPIDCRPPGCFCKNGFVRDGSGNCVPVRTCYPCGPHEHWEKFVCDGTCDSPPVCMIDAKPGCACDTDYVRHNGICIKSTLCPPKCRSNEEYLTCGYCEQACGTGGPKCDGKCLPASCYCLKGFSRDKNGNCIPKNQCPEYQCGSPGQVWSDLGLCERDCNGNCVKADTVNQARCYCSKEGWALDANGNCIPTSQCPRPQCGSPGQVWSDLGLCERDCNGNCVKADTVNRARCYCSKEGWALDANGNCIPKGQCPRPQCGSAGQVWSDLGLCERDCNGNCVKADTVNQARCYCSKEGWALDANGNCIPTSQCPKPQCGSGQVWSDLGLCERRCNGTEYCAKTTEANKARCYCSKDGWAIDDKGNCIPIEKCGDCPPNSIWMWQGVCEQLCGQKETFCTQEIKPAGCYCTKDFYRVDKECIPKDKCPKCKDRFEVYKCGNCQNTCMRKVARCSGCTWGCYCDGEYYSNKQGVCVTDQECT